METSVDGRGRILVPKAMRDALGLIDGSRVDILLTGATLQIVPTTPTARIVASGKHLVATGDTAIDDEAVLRLRDASRR